VAYLLGEREFWSLPFHVTPRTLVPRPESETVVEAALAHLGDRGAALDILDLGTGCGCLLLALLHELGHARGVGVDIDAGALAIARGNAERLGLGARADFLCGDWGAALDYAFDLVVANPPYVAHGSFHALATEITAFEPVTALLAGTDGLACYREIVPALPRLLGAGGLAVLEIGARQAASVSRLLADAEMRPIAVVRDLARHARCIVATRLST
jgi:release factor glutamine methyltransferase